VSEQREARNRTALATVEQPKCAVADSARGDAVGRNAGFRMDASKEDPTLPRVQKTVPLAGRARTVIDFHFETGCGARRIHGDIDMDSWGNRNLAEGIIGELVGNQKKTLWISASGMAPWRAIDQSSPSMRTIVEASVPPVSPASRISGRRSPNCSTICSGLVQDGWLERLALVPVTGESAAWIRAVAMRESAQRSATRPVLPVTLSGRRCVASTTSVSAPGQNLCASVRNAAHQRDGLLDRIHEDRKRPRFRAPLQQKNPFDSVEIERIRAQAVKGVRGNGDDAPAANEARCVVDDVRLGRFRRDLEDFRRRRQCSVSARAP